MKLLHTSDWHLGMTFRNGMSFDEDQRFFIDKICEISTDNNVDALLIAGDIFDRSIASKDAINLYDEAVTYICSKLKIPVFIIAGNHDGAYRLASCKRLLKNSGLFIMGALEEEISVETIGDVDIYMLPWISTDKVKSIYPKEADNISNLEDAYRIVLDKYRASFDKSHKHVLMAHAFVTDSETSTSDRAAEVGRATMVSASVFEGFDYVALGHLHGPQQITESIRYSGTPMPYSFGKEEKQEKSVTIVDTDNMEISIVPVPLLRKRTTISGTYDEISKADFSKDILEGYVRLEVTDSYVGIDTIASFREKYKYLLEVAGKTLEKENSKITMTMDELEEFRDDPETVFARYCEDILEEMPDEHQMDLFRNALSALNISGEGALDQ